MRHYKPIPRQDIDFDKLVEIADPETKKIPYIPLKIVEDLKKGKKSSPVAETAQPVGKGPAAGAALLAGKGPAAGAALLAGKGPAAGAAPLAGKGPAAGAAPLAGKGPAIDVATPRVKATRLSPGTSKISLFAQLLRLFKLIDLRSIIVKHKADKYKKTFLSWDHLVCMIFAQLTGAGSLREVEAGLALSGGAINHLGLRKPPSKSNLSDANNTRPWQFFKDVFVALQAALSSLRSNSLGKKKFKFKHDVYSMDSSTISLSLEVYNWARYKTRKGAVKLHAILEHESYLPFFAVITDGKKADIKVAEKLKYPKDSILVFDRGYVKLSFFKSLQDSDCFFVTRLKDNMKYEVVGEREPPKAPGRPKITKDPEEEELKKPCILKDQLVKMSIEKSADAYPEDLRLVTAQVEDTRTKEIKEMVFVTNILHLSAATISALYRDRWAIESFFRKIKQNLKIKSFLGTSKNAVQCQIWSALITILLLEFMKYSSKINWHISNLVYVFKLGIHTYYDLYDFLNNPDKFKEYCENRKPPEGYALGRLF
jgi:hypothetical protein